MSITITVNKCEECPYFGADCENGMGRTFCRHIRADRRIDEEESVKHIGRNLIPRDAISELCPIKKEQSDVVDPIGEAYEQGKIDGFDMLVNHLSKSNNICHHIYGDALSLHSIKEIAKELKGEAQ